MKKLPALAYALTVVLSLSITGFAQEQPRDLEANRPAAREISAGQRHRYTLNLKTNQIARVIVEQRGVDLVVAVLSPGGTTMFEVDSPTGSHGNETVTIVATEAGGYLVEVRPLGEKSAPGNYEIRLDKFLTESEYQTERLAGLGRLWGAVKFFHPYLAYKNLDWDGALIKAVPQVKSARTPEQYRQAISNMLQVLNDPLTTAELSKIEAGGGGPKAGNPSEPAYFRIVEGVVIVNGIDWARAFMTGSADAFAKQQRMMEEIGKAKGIVLDCRYGGVSPTELPSFHMQRYLNFAFPLLVQGLVPLGTQRYRVHNGYPPQQGSSSGGYSSALVTEAPGAIDGRAPAKKTISVIIDRRADDLIPVLAGLQAYGAKIVQAGKPSGGDGASYHPMQLPDGLRIKVRTTEFVHPDGGSEFTADAQLPDGTSDEKVISAAIAALNSTTGEKKSGPPAARQALVAQSLTDDPHPRMSFPTEEYRLLGLFRFWNVISYFFPYKHLIDRPWETVLTDFIPRFLENKTPLDYEMTVAEMVARIQDSHGFVRGFKSLAQHLGTHAPPIQLGAVGGKLVVVGIPDQAAAPGVKVGDVIVAIDGQSTGERIAYLSRFTALSTVQSGYSNIYPLALRGAPNSKARVKVESADGKVQELELARSVAWASALAPIQRTTPKVYEVLPSGYGYIDLERLQLADAQKALDAMMNTPAIIFDMRGYPNGTAWALAPRLTERKNVTAALFRRPFQSAANFVEEDFAGGAVPDFSFGQKLPPAAGAIYKGRVVMLINHEAISQAEHTCMFFEAATDVTFIGTPTNGANGDVTNLSLPGGIYVSFSGHDVRHADGRQLQRLGIQPTVRIEPTVAGVREGRDEVLEAAIKFLKSGSKK
jgi:C-terminal processing protease CtpA/Prc